MNGQVSALNNIPPIDFIPSTIPSPISDGDDPINFSFIQSYTSTKGCINVSYKAPPIAFIPSHIFSYQGAFTNSSLANKLLNRFHKETTN